MKAVRRRLGSTYRLQLNGLGFAAAAELVPFLDDLGVETCYLSPIATAAPGSTHGYDVIDPTAIDPALGGRDGLTHLLDVIESHRMKALVDVVPNHLSATTSNRFFADVLRLGRRSAYAAWFDVAWERADGRIVLPVLDGSIGEVLERGGLRVRRDADGRFGFAVAGVLYPAADLDPHSDDLPLLTELAGLDPQFDRAVRRQIELLLAHQHYRLVDWRVANDEINYRRFFSINGLIGVRQEDPNVFAATHSLVAELSGDPRIAGFRVDHVDGLADPGGYLERLRALVDADGTRHVIEIEKILGRDESLPPWPVDGTTGYDAGASIIGLLLDADGVSAVAAEQAAASDDRRPFVVRAIEAKRRTLAELFAGQVEGIVREIAALGILMDLESLRAAIVELTAHLDVYRTYRAGDAPMRDEDVERIRGAAAAAEQTLPDKQQRALAEVVAIFTGVLGSAGHGARALTRWQQLSSATVAKGVEDTACFDAGELLAVCEVGSDPSRPTTSVQQWYDEMADLQRDWPQTMTAGSTHDSKRSLDVRCRLAVLSEIAEQWAEAIARLDEIEPDAPVGPAARRYLYQTLVGAWPVSEAPGAEFIERVRGHLVKAAREAGTHSSWEGPDVDYETAYQRLASALIEGAGRDVVTSVVERIGPGAATNSLAAVVLSVTGSGVPDTYQGDDLWAFTLTDPDNRRPVDWPAHRTAMVAPGEARELLADWRSGRVKQLVLRRCLQLRRRLGEWWDRAAVIQVVADGPAAEHVVALAREAADTTVVAVVPRLTYTLCGPAAFPLGAVWDSTDIELPASRGGWRDVLTGRLVGSDGDRKLSLATALDVLPVAVIVTESA